MSLQNQNQNQDQPITNDAYERHVTQDTTHAQPCLVATLWVPNHW